MESSATNQKITWFKKEQEQDALDLSPSFQRRPVWTNEQASFLIDTILSGLPIPEIYLRSTSSPDGVTKYQVVDGQQRIRSILKFAINDLELEGDEVSVKWSGKTFDDLTPLQKSAFWDYKIVVRDVGGASDAEIRDLFHRLNVNSVSLNEQELRHAQLSGHFIKAMEALADDEWWLENKVVNIRQIRRMEDVEYVSELFIGLIAGPQDKKKTLDDYYEDFDSSMPEKSRWVKLFEDTLELIRAILPPEEIRKWSGKSDFYSLFLALGGIANVRLTSEQRRVVADALSRVRVAVDTGKKMDIDDIPAKDIAQYVEAVTRAASDRGRREVRLRILEKRITDALSKSAAPARRKIARR